MIGLLIFIASFTFSDSSLNGTTVSKDTYTVSLLGDPKKKPTRPKRMPFPSTTKKI